VSVEKFLKQRAVNIAVGGSYTLANWYDRRGKPRTFACRTTRVSPFRMLVQVPVIGKIGSPITSFFSDFGKLEGVISDTMQKVLDIRSRSPFERQNELRTAWTYWLQRKVELGITDAMPVKERIVRAVDARRTLVSHPPARVQGEGVSQAYTKGPARQQRSEHQQRGRGEARQAVQRSLRRLAQRLQEQEAGSALHVRIPRFDTERDQGWGL